MGWGACKRKCNWGVWVNVEVEVDKQRWGLDTL